MALKIFVNIFSLSKNYLSCDMHSFCIVHIADFVHLTQSYKKSILV